MSPLARGHTGSCQDEQDAVDSLTEPVSTSMYAEQPLPGRLETLSEISRAVSSTLDLRHLYDVIYQQVGRVMDTSQFFIALHQPGSDVIDVPYLQEEGILLLDKQFAYGDNTSTILLNTGDPMPFTATYDHDGFA